MANWVTLSVIVHLERKIVFQGDCDCRVSLSSVQESNDLVSIG